MNARLRAEHPRRVAAVALAHGHCYGLQVGTPAIVALNGRFRTGAPRTPGDAVLQHLVAALVGCASRRHGEYEIAELFESRGASFTVEADADGLRFGVRACAADLAAVAEWTMACLREPAFDQALLDAERARLIAELHYRALDPAHAAVGGLTRLLYPPTHPACEADPDAQAALLESCSLDDVRRFHRERYGANDLRIAVVGDYDPQDAARLVERELAGWAPRALPEFAGADDTAAAAGELRLCLPGQESHGVALGQRLGLTREHADYPALQLANRILGGAYASRLVASVRERQGLSYVIRSALVEAPRAGGHWQIALSASPDKLQAALAATRAVVAELADEGVQALEFENARRAAIGAYQIGLATLDGLSAAILSEAELGLQPDDLQGYERRLSALDLAQVNRVIADCLQPEAWRACIAGPLAPAD
ncbi:M16 family metallopeptidase [Lysobacter sp. cf310]|uniref:M16 family metallopeptidase n=1 Tax=Lysobacter sp. cf310 TaxID=1761790 RepID=UPI0008E866AE|nr:pitrilysin family protein [Lysobacter sp. cf310]SFK51153.1 Predicted Zn-dependent peptidase [Lysobacter sp. cf310]